MRLNSLITKLSLILGIGVSVPLWATGAMAAEQVVLKYSVLRQSVSVAELTTLAETGETSRSLRRYLRLAGKQPEEVRQTLTEEAQVNVVLVDRGLNNPIGDTVLDQVGEAIYPPSGEASREALRSALVLSASDDDRISLIEVIQNYPTDEVVVDGDRLVAAYGQLQAIQERFGGLLEGGLEGVFDNIQF
ncbi:alpha/beta hydrolase [Cyanobacteria bacterium FACHB-471]|nr:alpha/beta hydrolase [Cyanobacteria bacterium FACHB-471]